MSSRKFRSLTTPGRRSARVVEAAAAITLLAASLSAAGPLGAQESQSTDIASALPRERGRDQVIQTCGNCHALGLVVAQGRSAKQWAEVIDRMRGLGASVSEQDAALITAFLARHFPARRPEDISAVLADAAIGGEPRFPRPEGKHQWPAYGGGDRNQNFSPLTQIDEHNVARLEVAWVHRYGTGEHDFGDLGLDYRFEVTPLVIGDVMYISTPSSPRAPDVPSSIRALDPTTGELIWKFESPLNIHGRGIAYWPGDDETAPRIIFGTDGGYIMAVDVTTGTLAPEFGRNGVIDAYIGVASEIVGESRRSTYTIPNPVTIYEDLVIVGARPGESGPPGPRGDIRAFSARTGRLAWTFHTAPRPGEPHADLVPHPEENHDVTGANVWSTMALDAENGIVYAPLGDLNARVEGPELFANSLVALDADTGELVWYRQLTHKDLWDWDLPTPPVLLDLERGGDVVPAVLQASKQGLVFLFNRLTGEPLNGFEERPTPRTDRPGVEPWPTQPFPTAPGPIARTGMTRDEIPDLVPGMGEHCRALWDRHDPISEGLYALPRADRATVTGPGPTGGPNWGGGSYHPELGLYVINVQNRLRFNVPGGGRFSFSYPYEGLQLSCSPTPWGELVAVDVRRLEIAWRSPLGVTRALGERGLATGAPNLGGNIVTASGLVFIGASNDRYFRAFDARTGDVLWETELPASAHSTPVTYIGRDGRQYIVVAAGGGTSAGGPRMSDSLVAFALPEDANRRPGRGSSTGTGRR